MLRRFSTNILVNKIHSSTSTTLLPFPCVIIINSHAPIHEKLPRVKNYIADENIEAAKAALVQLNLMVTQGTEPDAQMYTSLITVMGKAKLEWQAFKLFSRMLEQGVKPLPETYLALKRATNPKRVRIIQQLEEKMMQVNELLPEQLANTMKNARETSERAADREMRELKNPSSFASLKMNQQEQEQEKNEKDSKQKMRDEKFAEKVSELWGKNNNKDNQQMDIPKMGIDSLESVLAAVQQLDARNARLESIATGEQRQNLSEKLNKLHEEELRIVLSIHRQLRTGTKQQLLNRILSNVSAKYLEEMFERRRHYFDSVKQVLELQIEELKEMEKNNNNNNNNNEEEEEDDDNDDSERQDLEGKEKDPDIQTAIQSRSAIKDQITSRQENIDSSLLSYHKQQQYHVPPKNAFELTPQERFNMSPGYLEAPWGLLRRPRKQPENPATINQERDERMLLSQQELVELQNTLVMNGSLEQIPSRLLRRYCRHFHLKWSRKAGQDALQDLVEWHLRTFKPGTGKDSSTSTVEEQRQQQRRLEAFDAQEEERKAQQKTFDQYNALVAVARMTENMKLVDDANISRAVLERQQKERLDRKRATQAVEIENWKRRKEELDQNMRKMPFVNVKKAQEQDEQLLLKKSDVTKEFGGGRSNSSNSSSSSSVLGATSSPNSNENEKYHDFNDQLIASSVDAELRQQNQQQQQQQTHNQQSKQHQQQQNIQELPPWEASTSSSNVFSPFNLRTGRFDIGVPQAEYYEDSTGRVRVRQPQILKQKYSVDESLLPAPQQARIQRERLMQEQEEDRAREEEEEKRGKHHWRSIKYRNFLNKFHEKEKEMKSNAPKPVGPPVRMSKKFTRMSQAPVLHK